MERVFRQQAVVAGITAKGLTQAFPHRAQIRLRVLAASLRPAYRSRQAVCNMVTPVYWVDGDEGWFWKTGRAPTFMVFMVAVEQQPVHMGGRVEFHQPQASSLGPTAGMHALVFRVVAGPRPNRDAVGVAEEGQHVRR